MNSELIRLWYYVCHQGSDKKDSKEKKKAKGIFRSEKSKSLIPLFREPSSIEKILGEADQLLIRPTITNTLTTTKNTNTNTTVTNIENTNTSSSTPPVLPARSVSPKVLSPKAASPPPLPPPLKALTSEVPSSSSSSKASVPKVTTKNRKEVRNVPRPEPTSRDQHISAMKIQAAFRGYMARRSFRAIRGLVRLQEVVRSQNVKRQTANAMKQLQLLVRVQTQIQSRRIQMSENQRQDYYNHNKDIESTLSKWTNQLSENEDWDDSLLTKEEVEARLQKKVEALIKRERAMAYAYSHQLWKASPKSSAHSPLDTRWWNWLDRQLPESGAPPHSQSTPRNPPPTPPPRGPTSQLRPSPRESLTPRSAVVGPTRARRPYTPSPMKDDNDSLMSCPQFSVPSYMAPTVSARAKSRANSNPRERFLGTPDSRGSSSSRRFSFPLTPTAGEGFGWGKAGPGSRLGLGKHELARSVGEFSVGSAVSTPAVVGRKPFNRFV
ncbi:IQ domain-containing protein [Striga asiatica]|uniref:IQ domain-containing protein n=1 Tax=Striga asiatica TaxID=4170 RepID=A0A5A7PN07_STRAF|nr:IQ domain-containing protein [Striga asiatica]